MPSTKTVLDQVGGLKKKSNVQTKWAPNNHAVISSRLLYNSAIMGQITSVTRLPVDFRPFINVSLQNNRPEAQLEAWRVDGVHWW